MTENENPVLSVEAVREALRSADGALNALALACFIAVTMAAVLLRGKRQA
jgi:hypothetical protein